MKITGTQTRKVEVEISEQALVDKLYELLKFDKGCYVSKGNLMARVPNPYYDEFREHSYEEPFKTEFVSSNKEDIWLFNALKVMEERLCKNNTKS